MKTEAWIKKRIANLKAFQKRVDKEQQYWIKHGDTKQADNLNILQNKLLGSIVELERVIEK